MIPPLVLLDSIYERWTRLLKEPQDSRAKGDLSDTITDLTDLKTELNELIANHPEVVPFPKCYLISSQLPSQALLKAQRRHNVV